MLNISSFQLCTNTRSKLYRDLLSEHKQLSDKHKLLQAELRDKGILFSLPTYHLFRVCLDSEFSIFLLLPTYIAGAKEHVDELLKRIADIQGKISSVLYFALALF